MEAKEDLVIASFACAKGGVTSFLGMPNTRSLAITQAPLDDKPGYAPGLVLVDLETHRSVLRQDLDDEVGLEFL